MIPLTDIPQQYRPPSGDVELAALRGEVTDG
jgi:hypothetical protein